MSNRLTFSLASLIVLIALGLVVTPAMAATFPDGASVADQIWVQGQGKINIALPEATAEVANKALTVSMSVNGTDFDLPSSGGQISADGGPLQGLTYTITQTAAAEDTKAKYKATLTGRAHNVEVDVVTIRYYVSEADDTTDNPIEVIFTAQIDAAPKLEFPAGTSISNERIIAGNTLSKVLPAATGGVGPLKYWVGNPLSVPENTVTIVMGGDAANLPPTGINFTRSSRLLAGIPNVAATRKVVAYNVRDSAAGDAAVTKTLRFTIEVTARPTGPKFDKKVDDAKYTKGHAITAMTLPAATTTYATAPVTYTLTGEDATDTDPKLPKGLSFDATDLELTGTPGAAGEFPLTYTATDAAGLSDTATFKITVADEVKVIVPAPDSDNPNLLTHVRGSSPSYSLTIEDPTGGTDPTQTVVTGLPDELTFDKMKISGDPVAVGPITVTITATDELGASDTADFTITVNAAPNLSFDDVVVPQTYEVGKTITPMLLPRGEGGVGMSHTYAIDTATPLPAGISFDPKTRLLSGTPTEASAAAVYNYVISDSAFSHVKTPTADQVPNTVTLPITLTVRAETPNSAPTFGDATIPNIDATVNTPISGMFLPEATDADSGDTLTYSVSPSPTAIGLVFNPANRSLTGTPAAMMAQTAYTYKVEDGNGGEDTIGFFITVTGPVVTPPTDPAELRFVNAAGVVVTSLQPLTLTAGTAIGTTAMPYIQLPSAIGGVGDITYSLRKGLGEVDVTSGDNGLMVNLTELRLHGTPTAKAASMQYQWRATDARGEGDAKGVKKLNFIITVNAPSTPDNNAPVVTITTTPPTAAQTGSFPIAYTATDAEDADDTLKVDAALNSGLPAGYTVSTPTNGMVTITQAEGTNAANVTVTITATDSAGDKGSDSISVIFAERGRTPADTTAPTVEITVAPAANMTVQGTPYTDVLSVTLDFSEPINAATLMGKIGRVGGDNYSVVQISDLMVSPADSTVYVGHVNSPGYRTRAETRVLLKRGVADLAGNAIATDQIGIYTPPVIPAPTIAIAANPHPINCDTGSTIMFTITGSTQTLVDSDITISAGWIMGTDKNPADGTIDIVPHGNNAIGVTTVKISVAANAVMNAAAVPKGNAATSMTFTVGPVLMIPGNSFILVNHPAHTASHLNDPLVLGRTAIRAPKVLIQKWECMPDLTIFFGRTAPAIGGGAIVIKEADGPLGHDPTNALADIAKGSVGLSEIMWASDRGLQHGGFIDPNTGRRSRTNYDQTREQWIELHNRNSTPVKVTLFARPTNEALTIEADEIDRVSNYNLNNVWEVKGQNGNSEFGVDFVSMQRGRHDGTDDKAGLAPNTAAGYAHGDWNGSHASRWTASTHSYLTARAGLWRTLAAENQNYDFLGTPGRDNKPTASTPILRTDVKMDSIVFNEVANRRDQTLEWIELKNVSTEKKNLRKYQISLATAKGTDVAFYTFPDNDNIQLEPGEVLLLLDTSPRDNDAHPIAVGEDRDTGNDQALGLGQNQNPKANLVRYKIANFPEGGLPDDGNFVLYLRNRNDRLKSREGVIDVIGWSDKLADAANHTQIWPLQVFGAPDKRNSIAVETVHYRQHRKDPDEYTHGDKKDEHVALRDAGYTGIGYKRHAQPIAAHGGTPGYEDIRGNEVGNISATGVLTISEIMFDQGDGDYPQWIEIYNSSPTQAVNLHAGDHGWRLVIQNFDDGEIRLGALSGTLNFRSSQVQTILPQQTVIVTSTRARNSGSAFFDTRVVFPVTRVFSVWDDARGELDMKRSTDNILSTEGFYIELIDGKGKVSDSVGNLVSSPNRRVAATKEWELSDVKKLDKNATKDPDQRSSILRSYRKPAGGDSRAWTKYTAAQLMAMGITADGWIAAYTTDFREVRDTWYGHQDDIGTPGITGGRVLPVSLSKFRPERLDDGTIVVRWITESETNNAGFNILRSETKDGEFTKLNTQLIEGQGTTSERTAYTYSDTSAKPNVVYYYQIQDVSLDGQVQTLRMSRLKGHISAAGKLSTKWAELKALQ